MGNPVKSFDIGCRDLEKTANFYCEAFGWSQEPNGSLQVKVDTGSTEGIQGMITALGHEPHNYVMCYVETEDIQASAATIKELGGEVVIGPLPVPSGGQFAWWKDPEGNLMGLFQPE